MRIAVQIEDRASELLRMLISRLGDAGRTELHEAATHEVAVLVREHIRDAALTRHHTADNIRGGPATRTDHLIKAAESVEEEATAQEGTVSVFSPGFRRALGEVTILPREKSALTVPIHARAYAKTVGELIRQGLNIFKVRRKDGVEFLAVKEAKEITFLYVLKQRTTLQHDPGLLPTEDEFGGAAKTGVKNIILDIINSGGVA